MTQDALYISRTNADALIPTEVSSEIIQNMPTSSAALRMFKQLPNMIKATNIADCGFFTERIFLKR